MGYSYNYYYYHSSIPVPVFLESERGSLNDLGAEGALMWKSF